jgi:signal transduction histidine kinase
MRQGGGSEQPGKGRHANRARKAPIATPSIADLQKQLATLARELKEAREQQTATTEVLQVINASPGDLVPVFEAMLEKASRLCGVPYGQLALFDGELFRFVAVHGELPFASGQPREPVPPSFGITWPRLVAGEDVVHIPDVATSEAYRNGQESARRGVEIGGLRSLLTVALRKDMGLVGALTVYSQEVRPFTDEQISLLQSFAAQAVIAMENARVLGELRQRTDDLTESLEQQTATAEILRVISQSPTDVSPVLAAVAKATLKFCGALDVLVILRDGDNWFTAAHEGPITSFGGARPLTRGSGPGRAILDSKVVQIADVQSADGDEFPEARARGAQSGWRSLLAAPLLRDHVAIGAISLRRAEAGMFTPNQIELLKSFAAQSVIAIENVRLFTELREALEQQTATAGILRVISQSPTDVQPVLDAVARAAIRFCGVDDATVGLRDGEHWIGAAHVGPMRSVVGERLPLTRQTAMGRAIVDAKTVHIPNYKDLDPVEFAGAHELSARIGVQAALAAPLLREGIAVGAINLRRPTPGAFTPRQISMLESFTAQAVIALENTRLFNELKESLEQQTATAEILTVISQSPTDVGPVLSALARAAMKFCGANDALVSLRESDEWVIAAHEGPIETVIGTRRKLTRHTAPGRAMTDRKVVQIRDLQSNEGDEFPEGRKIGARTGFRSALAAPLLRDEVSIGAISLRRREAGEFEPRQIELLKTFAAQAVIAIENVRLFTELRDSLERLKAAQANLIQSEKMASLGQLTAGIAHEIKNPLNFVNNFAGLSSELVDELKQTVDALLAEPDEEKRVELQDTMDLLTGNLAKIVEHGRRADGIVKSMLAHSRGGTGDWQSSNINNLVEEALNLAYHGARAQDKDFNVTLERDFEAAAKPIDVVPQDVTRVFLNLIGNGFYATRKLYNADTANGYRPTLKISTRDLGDVVEIRVRDNGTGITEDVRAKLFQPFFTTKPTGEGTGLGLSISYDIVTQQHGGSIEVESEVGQYTEFTVRLPRVRRAATAAAGGD